MAHSSLNRRTIQVGEKTPLWTAQSDSGEINIQDYLGKTPILLIFYPADWSQVCTEELPMLDELINLSGKIELKAFGISADSAICHKAFSRQIGLQHITLISDPQYAISKAYGLLHDFEYPARSTVLIDREGTVHSIRIEKDDQPRSLHEMELLLQVVREWSGISSSLEEWQIERQRAMQIQREKPLAAPTQLEMRFWGTRGSIPVSGSNHLRYGGNTSCVSLTSDSGHLFIFDCGSGARELGNYLLSPEWNPPGSDQPGQKSIKGYIFLSHTHWDHIQGFPFFGPVFQEGNCFNILGWGNCAQTLASILAGQMEQIYFPVSLYSLPSELNFYSMQVGEAELDGGKIYRRLLKHPLPSTAYRLELGGKVFVYATDHEPHKLPGALPDKLIGTDIIDPGLIELSQNADVLVHDAQYSTDELPGKVGWGHNCAEIAVDTAIRANVKTLVLYHHDPTHTDQMIDEILDAARQRAITLGHPELEVVAAGDGLCLKFEL
ncbi:MAG TPA: redoxin domain-containing protein [Chloroflexia bacterium]|nr:redoxin domain-containing protein [Chloroflexia bacterium]